MCLIYRCKHKPPFIRLCKRTGRQGQYVELTPEEVEEWKGGCWGVYKKERAQRAKTYGHQLRFSGVFNQQAIDDMARYADAQIFTMRDGTILMTRHKPFSENIIDRAESFGWRLQR